MVSLGAVRALLVNLSLFLLGFVLLIKGSDLFVRSAAHIARKLGVSELTIGLTLVAVGTSIPELASSVSASFRQQTGIVIGNVVGSNIANIGLILGVGAAIATVRTREEILKRDGYIMVLGALLFYLIILLGPISVMQAIVFLLFNFAYSLYLFERKPEFEEKYPLKAFIRYFLKFEYVRTVKGKLSSNLGRGRKKGGAAAQEVRTERTFVTRPSMDFLILVMSFFAIVFGANFLVEQVVFFANLLGVPDTLIAISLVALGTSLPELSVTISAARKGHSEIAVGNIIGSNIANISLILGVSGLIFPLTVTPATLFYTVPFMIFMSLLLLVFTKSGWEISRREGVALIIMYVAFMIPLFLGIVSFS